MANIPYSRQHADVHTSEMIAWYLGLSEETAGRLTDLNPGSNLRDIFEAIALKLEALDNTVYTGLRAAIPQILYEWFGVGDGITTFVGFPKLPALPGKGTARFLRAPTDDLTQPVSIPAGTRLVSVTETDLPTGITYATDLAGTIVPLALTADILITASAIGPAGSVAANRLRLLDGVTNVAGATNPTAIIGVPEETDEHRRQRFMVYIRNLARCQCEGLEAGAMTAQVVTSGQVVEHVLEACAMEPPNTRGLVDLFIDNGNGSATPQLVSNTQQIIDGYFDPFGARVIGYKAAGIVVRVKPVTPTAVPVTVAVQIDPLLKFADVKPAVETAITDYIYGLGIGNDLVWTELTGVIATVPGVIDHAMTTPRGNVAAAIGGRIIPGLLTVTQLL
jgi:hypothetical protein